MRFIQSLHAVVCTADSRVEDDKDVRDCGERSSYRRGPILDRSESGVAADPDKGCAGSCPAQDAKGKAGEVRKRHGCKVRKYGVRSGTCMIAAHKAICFSWVLCGLQVVRNGDDGEQDQQKH